MSSDRVFFIAEAGVNHNGSVHDALAMIDIAADAGADAVKFQTAIPEEVISVGTPKAPYQAAATGADESQLEMVRKLHFGSDRVAVHRRLAEHAAARGLIFLSTPFDLPSLDMLVREIGLRTLKVSSGDVTNGPLLLAAAQADCDVILSTGMSTLADVEAALSVLACGYTRPGSPHSLADCLEAWKDPNGREAVQRRVTLLHCVTAYPTPSDQANLKAMDALRLAFGTEVGFSDHTLGTLVTLAAVARGASTIEKHFTLDRSLPGPDHAASLEPDEIKGLIASVREVERALGSGVKEPQLCEHPNIAVARRSIVAREAIRRDEPFDSENLTAKRPGTGISPMFHWELMSRPAKQDYAADQVLSSVEIQSD